MHEELKNLYALQEIDSRIHAAKKSSAALDNGATTKAQAARLETELQQSTDRLRALEGEMKDCELNLKTIETKKQNYNRRMYAGEVTNPKELESMEKEIAMLDRNADKLETRILELMDVVQEQKDSVSKTDSLLAQLNSTLAATVEAFNRRSKELSEEIAKDTAERTAKAQSVDEILLRRYEALRAHASGIGVTKVEDGKCGACHVALTPYGMRMVRESEELPFCESCGRILFLDE